MDNGQLTIIGGTNVLYLYPSVKVRRERPMCRSALVGAPCLSLWERWPSAARTERVYVYGTNGRSHSKTLQGPLSLGFAEPALPEGEPRGGRRYRSTAQVLFATWPAPRRGWMAAGCRRYIGSFHSSTQVLFVTQRNGTQAVPYRFSDWWIFQPAYSKNRHVRFQIIDNCQLSIVNSDITVN